MKLEVLIPAIVTYARSKGGFTTKTKLLKLLYLFDVEAFRKQRKMLTGFNWIFHKYGPWATEYDGVLAQLERSEIVSLHSATKADLDTVFVDAVRPVQLADAFSAVMDEIRARRIIEVWAERPTGEILDYVYFHTAPMRNARRGEPLDFSTVFEEEPAPDYKRTASPVASEEKKRKQRQFRDSLKNARSSEPAPYYVEPSYDAEFWRAIETLDRDPD